MKLTKGQKLIILGVLLVVIDQVSKVLVKTNMEIGQSISVIGEWFRLVFIENKGMAFGMAFGGVIGKYALTLFRIGLFAGLTWYIGKLCKKGDVPTGVLVGLTLIDAGAFGNIIDCLFYGIIFGHYAPFMQGQVVDMLYFPIIRTDSFVFFDAIFNFADSCVTVGAFYLILFQSKFFTSEKPKEKEAK